MLRSSVLSLLYRSRFKAAGAGPIGGRDDARGELHAPKVTGGFAPSTYLREHRKRGVAGAGDRALMTQPTSQFLPDGAVVRTRVLRCREENRHLLSRPVHIPQRPQSLRKGSNQGAPCLAACGWRS